MNDMELILTPNTLSPRHYNRLHDTSLGNLCLPFPFVSAYCKDWRWERPQNEAKEWPHGNKLGSGM